VRSLDVVPQRGGDVGGAGEVQDVGQFNVFRDQPPPACRRCGALLGSGPQRYPVTPVRRPPLSIVSMTLPTPWARVGGVPEPVVEAGWMGVPQCFPIHNRLLSKEIKGGAASV
jgi:hypothetical protein